MTEESLKKQAVRGIGWSFADSMLGQGITFLVGLILARLLSPDEYGLIGIITIFIMVFNSIVDSGFSNAIIRKKDASNDDYNTMFIVNLGMSIFLFALLYVCAPFIASFFHRDELTELSRAMGIVVILNALSIVQLTILTKRLDFKVKTKASFISSVTSGVIGICMAYTGLGVWSLVGQQISMQLLNTICLWIFNRWTPTFKFSKQSFLEMWSFGWNLLVSKLIDTVWNELYQVVIGKCYTPATLGLYTRAQQFGNIFSSNLTNIVRRVSFPTLSKIQDDKFRLKAGYKRTIKCTMLVTFVLMLGMAGCAKQLILILIGEQWLKCAPMLQLICLNMMLYPLHALNLNMLQVQGRSDLFLRLEIIKKVIAIGPILIGIFFSIYWMLATSVITSIFALYLNAYCSGPFLDYSIKEQISDIFPSFIIASIMLLVVWGLGFLSIRAFLLFPLQVGIGAVIVFASCELSQLQEYNEIKNIVISIIHKFLNK